MRAVGPLPSPFTLLALAPRPPPTAFGSRPPRAAASIFCGRGRGWSTAARFRRRPTRRRARSRRRRRTPSRRRSDAATRRSPAGSTRGCARAASWPSTRRAKARSRGARGVALAETLFAGDETDEDDLLGVDTGTERGVAQKMLMFAAETARTDTYRRSATPRAPPDQPNALNTLLPRDLTGDVARDFFELPAVADCYLVKYGVRVREAAEALRRWAQHPPAIAYHPDFSRQMLPQTIELLTRRRVMAGARDERP